MNQLNRAGEFLCLLGPPLAELGLRIDTSRPTDAQIRDWLPRVRPRPLWKRALELRGARRA